MLAYQSNWVWEIAMQEEDAPIVIFPSANMGDRDALLKILSSENDMGFKPALRVEDVPRDAAMTEDALRQRFPNSYVIFQADARTFADDGFPILCIDPTGANPSFRTLAIDLWIVENNIQVGNQLFEEFLDQLDDDGLLRGFDEL